MTNCASSILNIYVAKTFAEDEIALRVASIGVFEGFKLNVCDIRLRGAKYYVSSTNYSNYKGRASPANPWFYLVRFIILLYINCIALKILLRIMSTIANE